MDNEKQKGYDYAKLTYEAHLDLTTVFDLIKPMASEEFLNGYMEYYEEE